MIDPHALPANEMERFECISINHGQRARFLMDFHIASQLFWLLQTGGDPQNGEFGGVYYNYRLLVARDGALSVYHYGCVIDAIRQQVAATTVLKQSVDTKLLREAAKRFSRSFPHIENIRHGIAHAGELYESPDKIKLHKQKRDISFPGGTAGGGGLLHEALFGKSYSIGFEGTVFSIDVDPTSLNKLANIGLIIDHAFGDRLAQASQP